MLIPRFTIRWLLGLTTLCAGLSLIISMAVQGQAWAIGMSAGLGAMAFLAVLFVQTFLFAWLVALVERAIFGGADLEGVSPFADKSALEPPITSGPLQHDASEPPHSLTG